MSKDQTRTTEKSEAPLCIKHGIPINLELEMCEDCAFEIHDKVLANMGTPEAYYFPDEHDIDYADEEEYPNEEERVDWNEDEY